MTSSDDELISLDEDPSESRLSFFGDPSNWPLFYHTAKNMKARQLAGIAERKARHVVIPRLPIDFDQRYDAQIPNRLSVSTQSIAENSDLLRDCLQDEERERYQNLVSETADGTLTFLNRSIEFGDEIDWEHEKLEEYPLLWRLKLQSFEFLEWAVLGFDDPTKIEGLHPRFQRWLLSWTAENPIGEPKYLRRSWIPHSVSLRILNWSRYAAWCEQADISVDKQLYRQIYKNALFLETHIEFEVGGNHLIENSIALVVAGVLFDDHDTDWIETGLDVLERAGETQFLADGGHFERSPMYHVMVLRRYITALDLSHAGEHELGTIQAVAREGLGFLQAISKPDGEIPLLNDSVRGEQLSATTCLQYGRNCSLRTETVQLHSPDGSDYRLLETDFGKVLFDVGGIGPPHLPAHSHNDHLSILLWADGKPILTDTGVYDYAQNIRRQYARGVQAHNTAQFDSIEPIQTGGRYLMGKRNTPTVIDEGANVIEATYAREGILGYKYTHRRLVSVTNSSVEISDVVLSNSEQEVTIRYHFAPTCDIEQLQDQLLVKYGGDSPMQFDFQGADSTTVTKSPIFERYGDEAIRPAVEITTSVNNEVSTVIRHADRGI